MPSSSFPPIRFTGRLRPSQQEVVEIARRQLDEGRRRLHIVAPPGSGKTVLGLYLWAECVRRPALVLSPNSAIQAQWAARTELFDLSAAPPSAVSTSSDEPGLLTSLTYQSVTLPARGSADWDAQAIELWQEKLIADGQAEDPLEAAVWIDDLARHNAEYYAQRLSAYRKQVRDEQAMRGEALETLHRSAWRALERLRDNGIGMIILDECHHLLGHWGRVLADAHDLLAGPLVVGLTATPPDRDGKHPDDLARYDQFFGEVDYEVPLPAVVKDGFLAPYQDLAYFVRPSADELAFVAGADDQLHQLVAELCAAEPQGATAGHTLPDWLASVLAERRLPVGVMQDWATFERRDPDFALAARRFLLNRGGGLPAGVPRPAASPSPQQVPEMEYLVPVLDRYVRHHLRRSADAGQRELAERLVARLRTLGVQITDTGCQACASPVGRVLAYSRNKAAAVPEIVRAERQALGDAIRVVVVTDYEKTSAVTAEIAHLLDREAGGAVAVFRELLSDPHSDALDPILVTGSSVLVDDDLAQRFDAAAQAWLAQRGYDVRLVFGRAEGFHTINGSGGDWCPRVYVAMITELFQRGLTRCLVGTRGLLGEGWDASKINVLIDLTTVTTSMSVNQLRGRSIRLDADLPDKLADNWDVVCIAPEFSKGLDDYRRFIAKHKTLYGLTDDGAIEKGVGHVHAAFTELRPEGLEESTAVLNADMLARVGQRADTRQAWRIGEPYRGTPVRTLEARLGGGGGGFPPFAGAKDPWNEASLATAIGRAILAALQQTGRLEGQPPLHVGRRKGGYVRLFLENASHDENRLFTAALQEALGPLDRPRYVIPRLVDQVEPTWLSRMLPQIVGRYFRRRRRHRVMLHAVPSELARNKDLVAVYQRYWNRWVSPGQAVYAHRGAGERMVEEARRAGQVPAPEIHAKDVFL